MFWLRQPLWLILLGGCIAGGDIRRPPIDDSADTRDTAIDDTGEPDGPCPSHMVLVDEAFCIDRYEGALEEHQPDGSWTPASPYLTVDGRTVRAVPAVDAVPQGYISGDEAAAACAGAGKRLCASAEWLTACQGPDVTTWPYGDAHLVGACNDDYPGGHPVVDYFGTSVGVWDPVHMNNPGINQQEDSLAAGVFDMHGNLHEWVDDADGKFRGGFYADAALNGPGCTYVTTAHSRGYHDYSTGFRCCADPD